MSLSTSRVRVGKSGRVWRQQGSYLTRESGGHRSRFLGTAAHAERDGAALAVNHPALLESRSLFRLYGVVPSAASPRLLVSGVNSPKIGKMVEVGPWRGMPIFTLTLEERATCPMTCDLLAECYGNAMPRARRHRYDADLIPLLDAELRQKALEHPRGFVVRLHVLGDFPDVLYARHWVKWIASIRPLRVFGYTAHRVESEIGSLIQAINVVMPRRWVIRFSVPPGTSPAPMQATTIWRIPEAGVVPEGISLPRPAEKDGLLWDLRTLLVAASVRQADRVHRPRTPQARKGTAMSEQTAVRGNARDSGYARVEADWYAEGIVGA